MAEDSALEVAKKAWDCWVAEDLEGFLALWEPGGVWTNSGQSQVSGAHKGVDAIGGVARTVFEVSGGTFKAVPLELAASGDDAVLGYFHMEAERPGASINQNGLQRIVIRNGKLVTLDNVYCDGAEFDAFFA